MEPDPFIEKKMKELSNIYRSYMNTTGEVRELWCTKWYEMARIIAAEIRLKDTSFEKQGSVPEKRGPRTGDL